MLSRWVSALIAATILFSTTYFFGSLGVVLLSTVVVIVALCEFTFLFSKSNAWSAVFIATSLAVYATHMLYPTYTTPALLLAFVVLASKGVVFYANQEATQTYTNIEWTLWGVIYCALFPALTLQLTLTLGWKLFYFLGITVFLGDSFALFTGMIVGGKKIFPKISPKKTISGAIGGLVGSCLFGVGFMYFASPTPIDIPHWILICVTIGFFAQFGDFFESLIKRYSGKKDSGKLMPGHGGFLDRIDGAYFGSVILYIYSQIYDLSPFF
ncbi:MAG: phosphatidate cytidylyltransferase [Bdellovibrionaceae bacterium]|nr:phosphatidate cytidylyltransferase [Pseudobdellovibrionaceae bacterium]